MFRSFVMSDHGEQWRPIKGWEGRYEVSSHGRVRSLDRMVATNTPARGPSFRKAPGKILSPTLNRYGYRSFVLVDSSCQKNAQVHICVCEAFHGSRPAGREVAHFDGDRTNNRADNLRWATRTENMDDARRIGRLIGDPDRPKYKLTAEQVLEIYQSTSSIRKLAAQYSVSESQISRIRARRVWRRLLPKPAE